MERPEVSVPTVQGGEADGSGRARMTTRRRKPAASPPCVHHYVLEETPNGPTSKGKCKYCPATGEWSNLPPVYNHWRRYPQGGRYAREAKR